MARLTGFYAVPGRAIDWVTSDERTAAALHSSRRAGVIIQRFLRNATLFCEKCENREHRCIMASWHTKKSTGASVGQTGCLAFQALNLGLAADRPAIRSCEVYTSSICERRRVSRKCHDLNWHGY